MPCVFVCLMSPLGLLARLAPAGQALAPAPSFQAPALEVLLLELSGLSSLRAFGGRAA